MSAGAAGEPLDFGEILGAKKGVQGKRGAVPFDDNLRTDSSDTIQARWEKQQDLGRRQKEAGVEIPVKKHRCDDHLEDVVRIEPRTIKLASETHAEASLSALSPQTSAI